MRSAILLVHRWLGLIAGVVFAIASITGAVVLYQDPLDRLLGGPQFPITPGLISPAELDASLASAFPAARVTRVDWPTAEAHVFRVGLREAGTSRTVLLDAGSGRRVDQRPLHIVPRLIRRAHTSLVAGPIGRELVVFGTIASVPLILFGVILWWPGMRRLWRGLRIRRGRGAYILNFDLHQSLGILSAPLLLVLAVTGVLLPYPRLVHGFEASWYGDAPVLEMQALLNAADTSEAPRASLATLSAAAESRLPGGTMSMAMLDPNDQTVDVIGRTSEGVTSVLTLRADTAETVRIAPVPSRVNYDLVLRLHEGRVGGSLGRTLNLLACLIGFGLLPTGVVVWWIKRARKADPRRRSLPDEAGLEDP